MKSLTVLLTTCLLLIDAGNITAACLDIDGDNLCDSWELGCAADRTIGLLGATDTDNDFIRDDTEVGATGFPTTAARDSDGQGTIDACDTDSDDDGISDRVESGCLSLCTTPRDTDGDGLADYRDVDADGDSVPDAWEGADDMDGDSLQDYLDDDSDDDGLPDQDEGLDDSDGDDLPDLEDEDSDNDGTLDGEEGAADSDGDDIPNYQDPDDGDGPNADFDGDGLANIDDNCPAVASHNIEDTNSDGQGDVCDSDDDGDGIPDTEDPCPKLGGDGGEDLDQDGIGDACDSHVDQPTPQPTDEPEASATPQPEETPTATVSATPSVEVTADPAHSPTPGDDGTPGADTSPTPGPQVSPEATDSPTEADETLPEPDLTATPTTESSPSPSSGPTSEPSQSGQETPEPTGEPTPLPSLPPDNSPTEGGDMDGDGFGDQVDVCPETSDQQSDIDEDGLGDACDSDDDNDGVDDEVEVQVGTDPHDGADFPHAAGGTGCNQNSYGPSVGWVALLLVPIFRRRSGWIVFCLALPSSTYAQGFDAETFHPGDGGRLGVKVDGSTVLPAGAITAGTWISYAKDPVILVDGEGQELDSVVDRMATTSVRLAAGLPGHVELAALLPVGILQAEQGPTAINGGGLHDAHLSVKWQILRPDRYFLGLALQGYSTIPLGTPAELRGEEGVVGGAGAALDHHIGAFRVGGEIGYVTRGGPTQWEGATLSQQIKYGVALRWRPSAHAAFSAAAEVAGATSLGGDTSGNPAEALVVTGWQRGPWRVCLGGGAGLSSGVGAPDWRTFTGLSWSSATAWDEDRDRLGEGIDRCPLAGEDMDGFEDQDGCPDVDNDGDGLLDAVDGCSRDAEDPDGYQDADGCPEWDDDGDGLIDSADTCRSAAEDVDGFEDNDGCPDIDNDHDGVLDTADRCVDVAEAPNGFQDEDGCPDNSPTYIFTRGQALTFNNIFFKYNSYELLPNSYAVLDEIILSLQAQAGVRVRVAGHTDTRGDDRANLLLSEQRALAVVNYLAAGGVDTRRMEHTGYGETRPVAPNTSEAERIRNRRVEFLTLE